MTLAQLQRWIVDQLLADAWIIEHDCVILAEDQGDIETAVNEAVGRLGIVGMVVTPEARALGQDGSVVSLTASIRIVIYEEPVTNRHRANYCTALALAERVLLLARTWPSCTLEGLRQEPAGDQGVTVETSLTMRIVHDDGEDASNPQPEE